MKLGLRLHKLEGGFALVIDGEPAGADLVTFPKKLFAKTLPATPNWDWAQLGGFILYYVTNVENSF